MLRILFVDDDENILQGLRRTLRPLRNEMEAEFVDTGLRALAVLEKRTFDTLVTDMRMPGMDGMTLLKQVAIRYPHMLRIVLSGHSDLEAEVRSAGIAHWYFEKPCSFDRLKMALQYPMSPGVSGSTKNQEKDKWEVSAEIQELVPLFLDRRQADLGAIKRLLAEENFDEIAALAHNIKGSSASYGFPELSRLGAEIENAGLCHNKLLIECQVADFQRLLSTVPRQHQVSEPVLK
jgi:YesN/AraC family two-component response regulator